MDAEVWLREEEILIDRGIWTPPARRIPSVEASLPTLADLDAKLFPQ